MKRKFNQVVESKQKMTISYTGDDEVKVLNVCVFVVFHDKQTFQKDETE